MRGIQGKVALVTGASRGLGRASAVRLAQEGAAVVVNFKGRRDAAEETLRLIEGAGSKGTIVQADVSVPDDAERLVKEAVAFGGGRLDILVNNAGITRDNLLIRMSTQEWDDVLNLNLRGAFLVTKAAVRPMLKQRWGRVVSIASIAGVMGNLGQVNYAAAKAGLIAFTKSVARELASRNITANAVAPGLVPTELTESLPEEFKKRFLEQTPLGRLGSPEDVAGVVAFLASDDAAYITGQVIVVDGGMVTA